MELIKGDIGIAIRYYISFKRLYWDKCKDINAWFRRIDCILAIIWFSGVGNKVHSWF